MLRRCWPAVWDWHCPKDGNPLTTIDTKQLLEDMDEFAEGNAADAGLVTVVEPVQGGSK